MAYEYNEMELMICVVSRYLEDAKTVAIGTDAPCATAMLAQKANAPNLVILFEAGGVDPILPQMPISVGDSETFFQAIMAAGMAEMMTTCSRGLVDYAFLRGAQIEQETEFELLAPELVQSTAHPSEKELRHLREEVDPQRLIIGRHAG